MCWMFEPQLFLNCTRRFHNFVWIFFSWAKQGCRNGLWLLETGLSIIMSLLHVTSALSQHMPEHMQYHALMRSKITVKVETKNQLSGPPFDGNERRETGVQNCFLWQAKNEASIALFHMEIWNDLWMPGRFVLVCQDLHSLAGLRLTLNLDCICPPLLLLGPQLRKTALGFQSQSLPRSAFSMWKFKISSYSNTL